VKRPHQASCEWGSDWPVERLTIFPATIRAAKDPLKIISDIIVGLQKPLEKYLNRASIREKAIGMAMTEAAAATSTTCGKRPRELSDLPTARLN